MRPPSSSWLKEIGVFRNRLTDDTYSIPSYPWLAPPLHSRIRSLIERWGVETELGANEPVLGHVSDKVDKLVMVKSGITGRCFGSIYGVKQPGMAFPFPDAWHAATLISLRIAPVSAATTPLCQALSSVFPNRFSTVFAKKTRKC